MKQRIATHFQALNQPKAAQINRNATQCKAMQRKAKQHNATQRNAKKNKAKHDKAERNTMQSKGR